MMHQRIKRVFLNKRQWRTSYEANELFYLIKIHIIFKKFSNNFKILILINFLPLYTLPILFTALQLMGKFTGR